MKAYIATKHVRHVAVWTAHTDQTHPWREGRYRAICGSTQQPNFVYPRQRSGARLLWEVVENDTAHPWWSKPLCRDCVKAARVIADAAQLGREDAIA